MSTLFQALGIVHIGVAALIVAGYVLSLSTSRLHPLMVWAARAQLLLGLAMVGIAEGGKVLTLDHGWVGAKLLVALGVVGCCEMASVRQRRGRARSRLIHVALGLTSVNILVAYLLRG